MTGVGVGLTAGPLAIQARFAQADSRVAAVTGLTLFVSLLHGILLIMTDFSRYSSGLWAERSV